MAIRAAIAALVVCAGCHHAREPAPRVVVEIRAELPGTSAEVKTRALFLPLEEKHSKGLFDLYQKEADNLGFAVEGEFTGGCADSGFTGALGIPTLCGLGPVGGKAHTDDEFCRLETLLPRTQALAATICALE